MKVEELLPDSSRQTALFAADFIIAHHEFLPEMITISFSGNKLMAMRVSRAIVFVYELEPELIKPFVSEILDQLCLCNNNSTIRNFLHLFLYEIELLDEERLGKLINLCFNLLESPTAEISPRALSMQILYLVSNKIPELKSELKTIIEFHYEEGSPGFKSTARTLLKKLNKEVFLN